MMPVQPHQQPGSWGPPLQTMSLQQYQQPMGMPMSPSGNMQHVMSLGVPGASNLVEMRPMSGSSSNLTATERPLSANLQTIGLANGINGLHQQPIQVAGIHQTQHNNVFAAAPQPTQVHSMHGMHLQQAQQLVHLVPVNAPSPPPTMVQMPEMRQVMLMPEVRMEVTHKADVRRVQEPPKQREPPPIPAEPEIIYIDRPVDRIVEKIVYKQAEPKMPEVKVMEPTPAKVIEIKSNKVSALVPSNQPLIYKEPAEGPPVYWCHNCVQCNECRMKERNLQAASMSGGPSYTLDEMYPQDSVGLGMLLNQGPSGTITVEELVAGFAAMKSGRVQVGDQVLGIDNSRLNSLAQARGLCLGRPGSSCCLTLRRGINTFDVELQRILPSKQAIANNRGAVEITQPAPATYMSSSLHMPAGGFNWATNTPENARNDVGGYPHDLKQSLL